jgi:hypothetical protein
MTGQARPLRTTKLIFVNIIARGNPKLNSKYNHNPHLHIKPNPNSNPNPNTNRDPRLSPNPNPNPNTKMLNSTGNNLIHDLFLHIMV